MKTSHAHDHQPDTDRNAWLALSMAGAPVMLAIAAASGLEKR